jgi:amino acid adenylation domain-containing protein
MSENVAPCVLNQVHAWETGLQDLAAIDPSSDQTDLAHSVPELFSVHAAAAPRALAVAQGDISLSYQELDQRATELAQVLRSLGVERESVVAIYLTRSPAAIVAALGVLKAGGAYLPLDPAYPVERLAFVLNDAQASVLVSGQCMVDTLSASPEHKVLLRPDGHIISSHGAGVPVAYAPHPHDLAYVIYTSGSTGQPKGVEITHASLLNLVRWHHRAFKVTPADRAAQIAALGFDAAVWEIWPYLTAGASVHLPRSVAVSEPEAIRDWLLSEKISISFLATPLAERAMLLDWPRDSALRVLLTGADTLHHYPPRSLRFQLVNNYGPTETTVVATSGTVLPAEHPDRLPTIGRPIDDVQVYILDEKLEQVPPGEPGELYIGGAGLARGYRNRPDLTRERFLPDPFSVNPGSRLYKTGDLARMLPDGQIAFLGRVDEQIKVRGFRIEPAEIVQALDETPNVQASIVVAREIAAGDRRLVAYFVPAPNAHPTLSELRNALAERLPEYMVPSTFVELQQLPLNASGKVSRAELPEPNAANCLRDTVMVPPRTPIEARLADMVAPLLGLDRVSVEDNFFLLGGHSLLGTQLIARIRDAFGVDLTLRNLFDSPKLSQLASAVEALILAKVEAMSENEAAELLEAATADGM